MDSAFTCHLRLPPLCYGFFSGLPGTYVPAGFTAPVLPDNAGLSLRFGCVLLRSCGYRSCLRLYLPATCLTTARRFCRFCLPAFPALPFTYTGSQTPLRFHCWFYILYADAVLLRGSAGSWLLPATSACLPRFWMPPYTVLDSTGLVLHLRTCCRCVLLRMRFSYTAFAFVLVSRLLPFAGFSFCLRFCCDTCLPVAFYLPPAFTCLVLPFPFLRRRRGLPPTLHRSASPTVSATVLQFLTSYLPAFVFVFCGSLRFLDSAAVLPFGSAPAFCRMIFACSRRTCLRYCLPPFCLSCSCHRSSTTLAAPPAAAATCACRWIAPLVLLLSQMLLRSAAAAVSRAPYSCCHTAHSV